MLPIINIVSVCAFVLLVTRRSEGLIDGVSHLALKLPRRIALSNTPSITSKSSTPHYFPHTPPIYPLGSPPSSLPDIQSPASEPATYNAPLLPPSYSPATQYHMEAGLYPPSVYPGPAAMLISPDHPPPDNTILFTYPPTLPHPPSGKTTKLNSPTSYPPSKHHPQPPRPLQPPVLPPPPPNGLTLTTTAATTSSGLSSTGQIDVLNAHNTIRANFQAPALVWSSSLQSAAQSWASLCLFDHSPYPYGENLALGSDNPASLVNLWYTAEFCNYNYSNPGFTAGHFTQVVWLSTSQVGCAMVGPADCPNGISNGAKTYTNAYMLVCEYYLPGNEAGLYSYNVMEPLVDQISCSSSTSSGGRRRQLTTSSSGGNGVL
ncbi:hypothetical protein CEUSTIGMA_g1803.t1 [Chlamydomonas eustigma]|uniref:SCP domain-containing protein n=1 Tax=Chlamydomonas eustigma TaxID=1157962 RepID=A0A250WU64_9CHLO|nr:hypothetical protein CEUSTIGMA_g1803.t1 [Chlamydomonas eustigma]|eukprot:GAX74354.1 hypothetical protein CEUSTIGMA_g1803.t1 [Chlamydomonas eustigma]